MKKFIHDIVNLKFLIGLYFFGITMVSTCVLLLFEITNIEIATLWEILGLSIFLGFAHLIYFTELKPIIKAGLNFAICLCATLAFDYIFKWGVIEFIGIPIFILALVVFYVGTFIAFYIYYKNEEQLLNEALSKLKSQI